MKKNGYKRKISMYLCLMMVFSLMTFGVGGTTKTFAADADVTMTETKFDFTKAFTGTNKEGEKVILADGTELVLGKLSSSGVSDGGGYIKYRGGNGLYLPIKDDTTKVVLKIACNQDKGDRWVAIGDDKNGEYKAYCNKIEQTVQVDDISDFVAVIDGKKYLKTVAEGEMKAYYITLEQYNPINDVVVTGKVNDAAAKNITSMKFKCLSNDKLPIVTAEVKADGTYSATLKRIAGNGEYVASVSAVGYGLDSKDDANIIKLDGNYASKTQDFNIVEVAVSKIDGVVTGIDKSKLKGEFKLQLIPEDSSCNDVDVNLSENADGSYTFKDIYIMPDMQYTVKLLNADDFSSSTIVKKSEGTYSDVKVEVAAKVTVEVSGKFVTSDKKSADVTKITFTNMETPEYSYSADVSGGSYKINLRAGEYVTSVESANYTAYDHVSVKDAATNNDVYLVGANDESKVPYEENITVGKGEKFETITSAIDYISRMERQDDQRVTINLIDNLYREQLIINTPGITIKSSRSGGSTISWYYGVGYSYYSAKQSEDGRNGCYYDEACAVDKYYKGTIGQNPGHWGATVNLFANATEFRAENIVFENSLNRYMTTEEVADGVTTNLAAALIDRSKATDADVLLKTNKERACAIYIQADKTEYKNCSFLSSQDTVYTGDSNEYSYWKNCVIEGTTDYICGDGNPVFDKCVLSMYGYSDMDAVGSYIVASKGNGEFGYLMNNCKIVASSHEGLKDTYDNVLARAWGPGKVLYYNTEVEKINMISGAAYANMNSKVTDAHYSEYNTHIADGTAVDTSARAEGVKILTDEDVKDFNIETNFNGWNPYYYGNNSVVEDNEQAGVITDPTEENIENNDNAAQDKKDENANSDNSDKTPNTGDVSLAWILLCMALVIMSATGIKVTSKRNK